MLIFPNLHTIKCCLFGNIEIYKYICCVINLKTFNLWEQRKKTKKNIWGKQF